jgi:hypothetical protein
MFHPIKIIGVLVIGYVLWTVMHLMGIVLACGIAMVVLP